MTSALFCLSSPNKGGHTFKYLIHPPQFPVHKVVTMNLQKPMIFFIFFTKPVTFISFFFINSVLLISFIFHFSLCFIAGRLGPTFFLFRNIKCKQFFLFFFLVLIFIELENILIFFLLMIFNAKHIKNVLFRVSHIILK